MNVRIVLVGRAPEEFDPDVTMKALTALLQDRQIVKALGLARAQVLEVGEAPDPELRSTKLHEVADELDRIGYDGLPAHVQGELLEVRLSLSVSRAEFPSASLDELLEDLEDFDEGEIEAMGPAGLIALFDSYARPSEDTTPAYDLARAAAEKHAGIQEDDSDEPDEDESDEDDSDEPDPEEPDPTDVDAAVANYLEKAKDQQHGTN